MLSFESSVGEINIRCYFAKDKWSFHNSVFGANLIILFQIKLFQIILLKILRFAQDDSPTPRTMSSC